MVGDSAAMQRLRLQLRRIGPHFRTVLIQGDSGTGKQTVAYALHRMSPVVDGPFLTSASGNRIGYLMKLAQHGTLYFDRVDEMPLNTQDEMLEVLCRSEWAQDGLAAPRRIHPRLIVSTTQDLRALTAAGQFRHELYQRIAMVQIPAPSLAERVEDIPLLASHFLDRFARVCRKNFILADDAMAWLKHYTWPGNVRELRDMLEKAALQTEDGIIKAEQFPALADDLLMDREKVSGQNACEPARLQDVVEQHVRYVLKNCAGNKLRAAELLGISRSTLYRMLSACSAEMQHNG
jgi:DNA-binding NtrC family response regulator